MLNNSDPNNDQTLKNGQLTSGFTLQQQAAHAQPSRLNGDNNSEDNGAQQSKNINEQPTSSASYQHDEHG